MVSSEQDIETRKGDVEQFPPQKEDESHENTNDVVKQKNEAGGSRRSLRGHGLQQWLLKRAMELVFHRQSLRFFACQPLRYTSLYFFDAQKHKNVKGYVALTFDDAPCRLSRSNSRMPQVTALLEKHSSKATFFVIGNFVKGHEVDLVDLLERGHELGNHGMLDRAYHRDDPQEFLQAIDECNQHIHTLQQTAGVPQQVKWFRAPHGKYTASMERGLSTRNLKNVMCDTYASCPIVQDGEYIGQSLARNAKDGSILLLHMPERGFRDWCVVALRRLLEELEQRELKAVTVSELERLANENVDEHISS